MALDRGVLLLVTNCLLLQLSERVVQRGLHLSTLRCRHELVDLGLQRHFRYLTILINGEDHVDVAAVPGDLRNARNSFLNLLLLFGCDCRLTSRVLNIHRLHLTPLAILANSMRLAYTALVSARYLHVFPVLGDRSPGYLDTLPLQLGGELVIRKRLALILFLNQLLHLPLQQDER